MKTEINAPLYDLTPSQHLMHYLVAFSIHKQVTQLPTTVTVDEHLDFDLLKKALTIEIERNDALRMRFVPGKKKSVRQYFLASAPTPDVKVYTFKTKEEQDKILGADAQKPVYYQKGECYRVIFYNSYDNRSGIYFNVSHVVSDAFGAAVFFEDLLSVYKALKEGGEMPPALPSFEKYVQKQFDYLQSPRYAKDRDFYIKYWKENGEPFYAGVHGPAILDKARKKDPSIRVPSAYDPLHDKADVIKLEVSKELTDAVYEYCKKQFVTPEVVFMYAMRAHCAKINHRTDDVLNIVMCNRRATKSDERLGGCLAQPLQCRTKTSEDESFADAVGKLASNRYNLVRHMNFPYMHALMLQRKEFGFKTSQGPSCFMFSWMPFTLAESKSGYNIRFDAYCMGRYVMPLYTFAVPDAESGKTYFYYMYRTAFIKESHIRQLHNNMVKALEIGTKNPDMTVGELFDTLDEFVDE